MTVEGGRRMVRGQGEERALPAGIVSRRPTPARNHPATPDHRPVAEADPAALPQISGTDHEKFIWPARNTHGYR
jgi:hypothetical protein